MRCLRELAIQIACERIVQPMVEVSRAGATEVLNLGSARRERGANPLLLG